MKKLLQKLGAITIPILVITLACPAQYNSPGNENFPIYHHPVGYKQESIASQINSKDNSLSPTIQSIHCLGGSGDEGSFADFMTQTTDGGFITCSYSSSANGDVSATHGGVDVWVIKFNASGTIQWKRTYGGSSDDFASRVIQTSDGMMRSHYLLMKRHRVNS